MKAKKQYTAEEKFLIIREAAHKGVVATCKKHAIDPTTYYAWKERYERDGIEGLIPLKRGPKPDLGRIRKLEKENAILKKLLAEKELIIDLQEEVIKKKQLLGRKR